MKQHLAISQIVGLFSTTKRFRSSFGLERKYALLNQETNTHLKKMRSRIESLSARVEKYSSQATLAKSASKACIPKSNSFGYQLPEHAIQSVVKIYCTTSPINFLLPWQRKQQGMSTGSGFVLDTHQKLLITNAHVVASCSFIEVRRHGDSVRYYAEIKYISADCDLALLSVSDPKFWKNVKEFNFAGVSGASKDKSKTTVHRIASIGYVGGLPNLQQSVTVVGYPYGGDQVSITQGVVSRIDSSPYGGIDVHLMAIQIDAAINPGNSGGPSICHGKVVGIAFQSLVHGDNIGYIIPIPIIAHFLRCFIKQNNQTTRYTPGHYHDGFCSIGSFIQELHNTALRRHHGIPDGISGILIRDVMPMSAASESLQPNDVVTRIDTHHMGNDATMKFRGERLRFSHFIQMKAQNERVTMEVIRSAKHMQISVPLSINKPLVPNHLFSKEYCEMPKYVVYCGCVFSHLSFPLLLEWGSNEWIHAAPRHLTNLILGGQRNKDRDEIVVLLQIFPHQVNQGYSGDIFLHRIVTRVNNVPVRNMAHFKILLSSPCGEFLQLTLQNSLNELSMVFPVKERDEVDADIRRSYNIPE